MVFSKPCGFAGANLWACVGFYSNRSALVWIAVGIVWVYVFSLSVRVRTDFKTERVVPVNFTCTTLGAIDI